jgi:hypothetical protein
MEFGIELGLNFEIIGGGFMYAWDVVHLRLYINPHATMFHLAWISEREANTGCVGADNSVEMNIH